MKCSACVYFIKMKAHTNISPTGLCDAKDCRTSSDRGSTCTIFKAIPFKDSKQFKSFNEVETKFEEPKP